MKLTSKIAALLTATLLLSSCAAAPTEEETIVTETASASAEETTPSEEQTAASEEEIELTYEVNTEESIQAVLNGLKDSFDKQTSGGFLELRNGVTSPDKKYQILLIESPTFGNNFYYYDTQRGFSQVVELNKNEIQYTHLLGVLNFTLQTFATNAGTGEALTEFFTFKKELPANVYILEESEIFGSKTTYRFEFENGLVSKIALENSSFTEEIQYQYGLSATAQKYIGEAFRPGQPVEEETPTVQ
jgi:hypothetical protein